MCITCTAYHPNTPNKLTLTLTLWLDQQLFVAIETSKDLPAPTHTLPLPVGPLPPTVGSLPINGLNASVAIATAAVIGENTASMPAAIPFSALKSLQLGGVGGVGGERHVEFSPIVEQMSPEGSRSATTQPSHFLIFCYVSAFCVSLRWFGI